MSFTTPSYNLLVDNKRDLRLLRVVLSKVLRVIVLTSLSLPLVLSDILQDRISDRLDLISLYTTTVSHNPLLILSQLLLLNC